jgi:hypothetical protein
MAGAWGRPFTSSAEVKMSQAIPSVSLYASMAVQGKILHFVCIANIYNICVVERMIMHMVGLIMAGFHIKSTLVHH